MAYALAKENEAFIERMLKLGRFNNQSEVVREALRRMERDEASYLNPPALTERQLSEIYGSNPQAEHEERIAGATVLKSIRKAAMKHQGIEGLRTPGKSGRSILVMATILLSSCRRQIGRRGSRWWKSSFAPVSGPRGGPMQEKCSSIPSTASIGRPFADAILFTPLQEILFTPGVAW